MGAVPNKWLFYVILLLVIISFRRKKDGAYEDLGRECTGELKGLAILAVLFGHLAHLYGMIVMPVTDYLGAQGVEIFLFLSGFGLTSSFLKKGMAGYWKKRLLTVYVPYTIVNILKLAAMAAVFGISFISMTGAREIVFNFLGLSIMMDTSMWYIQYILLCYIIFYLVFRFTKFSNMGKAALLSLIFFLMGLLLNGWMIGTGEYIPFMECCSHYVGFPLGIFGCLLYERIKEFTTRTLLISSAAFLAAFLLCSTQIPQYGFYVFANVLFVLFAVTLFIGLKRLRLRSALLEWLGGLAFHIYLNEYIVMMIVTIPFFNRLQAGKEIPGMALPAAAVILCSVAVAVVTKWIGDRCLKKLGRQTDR